MKQKKFCRKEEYIMKQASQVLYTIGRIFNIIGIVVTTLCLILPIMMMSIPEELAKQQKAIEGNQLSAEQIRVLGVGVLVGLIIAIIVLVVVLCLANYASKKLKNDTKDTAPHIIMIVIGIFGSLLYLIGGVLGLAAESEQNS